MVWRGEVCVSAISTLLSLMNLDALSAGTLRLTTSLSKTIELEGEQIPLLTLHRWVI